MSAETLNFVSGFNTSMLTKEENVLLEGCWFACICESLQETFKAQYKDYFYLLKFNAEKENSMLEENFVRLIINDILETREYDLKGIAYYTNTFEDVVEEIMIGKNKNPSAKFLQRLIDLHRSVRKDLYDLILRKFRCSN